MQPIRFKDLPDVLYVSDVARFLRLSGEPCGTTLT